MKNNLTMGSLFDGSGGFPLAAALCGITPVWASEIEPFPITVTRARFPHVKHYGDVSTIKGADIEPVDVISFGSPCQDLSIAGKRKGLLHEDNGDEETTRSGLFMEAIRIIKEMREKTNGRYPTFVIWENVPGAFSSNKGEDFKIVLEELEKIAAGDSISIPEPPGGKWLTAGEIMGDNYTIAWRTEDAQYRGVPQRRRRIYLVADFRGQRAGKILFEREGLRGDFAESREQRKETTANVSGSIETTDCTRIKLVLEPKQMNYSLADEPTNTLVASCYKDPPCLVYATETYPEDKTLQVLPFDTAQIISPQNGCNPSWGNPCHPLAAGAHAPAIIGQFLFENHSQDARYTGPLDVCPMLPAQLGTGGNNTPFVVSEVPPVICLQGNCIDRADTARCNGKGWSENISYTLNTIDRPAVCYEQSDIPYTLKIRSGCEGGGKGALIQENPSATLAINNDQYLFQPVLGSGRKATGTLLSNAGEKLWLGNQEAFSGDFTVIETKPNIIAAHGRANAEIMENMCPTLSCNHEAPILAQRQKVRYIVRRLTPLECCRLQGFPDWWTDNINIEIPTEEDLNFWREVFETHRKLVTNTTKPKTDKQIIKFLKDPYSDSAAYKMWGNGICLFNALFVMQGIAEELQRI